MIEFVAIGPCSNFIDKTEILSKKKQISASQGIKYKQASAKKQYNHKIEMQPTKCENMLLCI